MALAFKFRRYRKGFGLGDILDPFSVESCSPLDPNCVARNFSKEYERIALDQTEQNRQKRLSCYNNGNSKEFCDAQFPDVSQESLFKSVYQDPNNQGYNYNVLNPIQYASPTSQPIAQQIQQNIPATTAKVNTQNLVPTNVVVNSFTPGTIQNTNSNPVISLVPQITNNQSNQNNQNGTTNNTVTTQTLDAPPIVSNAVDYLKNLVGGSGSGSSIGDYLGQHTILSIIPNWLSIVGGVGILYFGSKAFVKSSRGRY